MGAGGGSIVNDGAVTVAAGATLKVTGDANGLVQSAAAATTDVDGTLIAVHGIRNNAGTLEGSGVVSGDVTSAGVVAGGEPSYFNPIGNLTITGNLTLLDGGEYLVTIGPGENSLLTVGGLAQLDGALSIDLFNVSSLALGDRFEIMDFGSVAGDFTSFDFLGQPCSSGGPDTWICARQLTFAEQFIGSGLDLVVTRAEVPEPGTWAMMTFGFAGLGLARYCALRKGKAVAAA